MEWNQCWELFESMVYKYKIRIKITIKSKHWNKHHANQSHDSNKGREKKQPVHFLKRKFIMLWISIGFSNGFESVYLGCNQRCCLHYGSLSMSVSVSWCRMTHKSLCYIIHFVCVGSFFSSMLSCFISMCFILLFGWLPIQFRDFEKSNQKKRAPL